MKTLCHRVRLYFLIAAFALGFGILPSKLPAQPPPQKLPDDYIVLAKMVSASFITDKDEPENIQERFDFFFKEIDEEIETLRDMKPSAEFVKIRDARLKMDISGRKDLVSFKSSTPDIMFILHDEKKMEKIMENLSEAEQEELAMGIMDWFADSMKLFAKYEKEEKATQSQLFKIAKKYSAAKKPNDGTVLVQYHDANSELLFIGFKTKEKTLHNVTIVATLRNDEGESVRNFYFVEKLESRWQNSICNIGYEDDDGVFGNSTIPDVNAIDVEVYSEDFSTAFTWKPANKK